LWVVKTNSRWRTAAVLKKSKNNHISPTVWPIATEFYTVMCTGHLNRTHSYKFEFLTIQDGGGRHFEKPLNRRISATIFIKFALVIHFDRLYHSTAKISRQRFDGSP